MRSTLPSLLFVLIASAAAALAQDYKLHKFERQQLTNVYYSEGANAGDINGDGKPDVVYGPYWYEGPDFKTKHEIYPAKPQNREGYADNFFNWVYDFNGDGWNDVLVVGFPGKPGLRLRESRKPATSTSRGRSTRCWSRSATSRRSS